MLEQLPVLKTLSGELVALIYRRDKCHKHVKATDSKLTMIWKLLRKQKEREERLKETLILALAFLLLFSSLGSALLPKGRIRGAGIRTEEG